MSEFSSIKYWLLESGQELITVLYPGGFKPTTGGHLDLMRRYASDPGVKEVRVLVGPGIRDGIDQAMGVHIAELLTSSIDKVTIEASKWPSPILAAYKEIETATPGVYALASSSKGGDYKRVEDFIKNHTPMGKYPPPPGVTVVSLSIDTEPTLYQGRTDEYEGTPISASVLRADLERKDFESFKTNYPNTPTADVKAVWDYLIDVTLNENTVTSSVNKHMTHAEDLVILGGPLGLRWVVKMLIDLFDELQGNTPKSKVTLSVKIDGAPAFFAWSQFPGLPTNGIAMKGLFSKVPKSFSTKEELEVEYSDRPELLHKLTILLDELPKLKVPKGEIWQGDFLFSDYTLQEIDIKGEVHYSFHPNTIFYVVPKDSKLGKKIAKAKVGVVWHTRYKGSSISSVSASYDAEASKLQSIPEIFSTDPYIRSFAGILNFTTEESTNIKNQLEEIQRLANTLIPMKSYEALINNTDLTTLFSIYQNFLIKSDKNINNVKQLVTDFIEFIEERYTKEAEKKKTEKGKESTYLRGAKIIDAVQEEQQTMELMVKLIIKITSIKEKLINKLNKISSFDTYLKMTDDKLKKTNQEGFAVSDSIGNVVKIVDRKEFSFSNFSPEVVKGWKK